jgi:ABC-2 type transport system ATP-binding protein
LVKYAIEANGLRKSYGDHVVLGGIDLTVKTGTIAALLGPNGAGKTTLIHILSTLVSPDGGSARIAGHDLLRSKREAKQSISLTGQFAAVDEVLTGEENLRMMCRLNGLTAAESKRRTIELLARFDLGAAARKRVSTYSGGMRRRLDLAISLVVTRPVLFLDEPTTGLDTASRRELWDSILELKQQGMTILLTTQYLEEADQLADHITVINHGRVVAAGTADELKSRVSGAMLELRNGKDELLFSVPTDGSLHAIRQSLNEVAHTLPGDARVSIRRPSMDDVFLALTAQQAEKEESYA